jgi:hypothetical protein
LFLGQTLHVRTAKPTPHSKRDAPKLKPSPPHDVTAKYRPRNAARVCMCVKVCV